jgi:hypothetical protein
MRAAELLRPQMMSERIARRALIIIALFDLASGTLAYLAGYAILARWGAATVCPSSSLLRSWASSHRLLVDDRRA